MTKSLPYCEEATDLYPKGPHDDLNKFLVALLGLIWLFDLYPGSDGLWLVRLRASTKAFLEKTTQRAQILPSHLPRWPAYLGVLYPKRLLRWSDAFLRAFHFEAWPSKVDDFLEAATTSKGAEREIKSDLRFFYKTILLAWCAWHLYSGDFWKQLLDWWYHDPEHPFQPVTPVRFIVDPQNPHVFKYEHVLTCNIET
jgi:hypothetical protein